ncbi:MAG: insulinase family protein [Rhizobiales bacterium]|nr:insulinase family protein [Hyphomicrobiales bacterium]
MPRAQAQGPTIHEFTLANGLDVVVIPNSRAPVVTHMIWYKAGAADEPPGKSGIAHFLEHLMFKGTKKYPAGQFSGAVAAMGGQENAFTSQDYTAYFQRVPRDKLAAVMAFEADRMTGLVLTDDNVRPELNVVLEEQNQRVANRPSAQFNEQIEAALYLNHPYGKPVIGWRHEIETLDREDALSFYRKFYTPNNAVLIVAGDVDPAEVKRLAEETYGKVERRSDLGPRHRPQEPPPRAERSLIFADPRVEQPRLQRDYLVPSYASANIPGEAEALQVLAHIFGSGVNSRLYRALVIDKGIAVDAGAWYQGTMLDQTTFGISARPRDGVTLQQLEQAIDGVVADFIKSEIAADELSRATTKLIANAVYAQDSQSSLARWYGTALTTGSTVAEVQAWPGRIRAVTSEAVRDAARRWLDKRRSVTGYLTRSDKRQEERRS